MLIEPLILIVLGLIYWRQTKMPTQADLDAATITLQIAIEAAAARVANALANPVSDAEIAAVNAATDAANQIAP